MALEGGNLTRVGNKTTASAAVSRNKAERLGVAEVIEGKVAAMAKPGLAEPKKVAKAKKALPPYCPLSLLN